MKVQVTKRAERRIEIVDTYWRAHRPEAPDLLKQELWDARSRLARDPYAGTAVVIGSKPLRRLLLPRSQETSRPTSPKPLSPVVVVHTDREEAVRLSSARLAEPRERRAYEQA